MGNVVITGVSMFTPLGIDVERVWSNLIEGEVNETYQTYMSHHGNYPFFFISKWNPRDFLPYSIIRRADQPSLLCAATTIEAFKDAGLPQIPEDAGLFLSTGDKETLINISNFPESGHRGVDPVEFSRSNLNGPLGVAAIASGIRGPSLAFAGGSVVSYAVETIRQGYTTVACVIGLSPYSRYIHQKYIEKGIVASASASPPSCTPFSKGRNGFTPGEATIALILESEQEAVHRGARIYAKVAGYKNCINDSLDMNAKNAISGALLDSGITSESIGMILSSANGSYVEQEEITALREVFKEKLSHIPVSTVKAVMGETFGMNDVMGVGISSLSLYKRTVPPCTGITEVDNECDPGFLAKTPLELKENNILVSSFDEGDIWTAVVLSH